MTLEHAREEEPEQGRVTAERSFDELHDALSTHIKNVRGVVEKHAARPAAAKAMKWLGRAVDQVAKETEKRRKSHYKDRALLTRSKRLESVTGIVLGPEIYHLNILALERHVAKVCMACEHAIKLLDEAAYGAYFARRVELRQAWPIDDALSELRRLLDR